MEVKIVEIVIPEQRRTSTVYVASDGREFFDKVRCKQWDHYLELQKEPVFKTCIRDVCNLEDETASLYHIRNDEDHRILMSTFSSDERDNFTDEYLKYGPGWYIYFTTEGYRNDENKLLNYSRYVKEREERILSWRADIESKMSTSSNN